MKDQDPIEIEYHVKQYGRVKSTGELLGLHTRLIITKDGKSQIKDFDYSKYADEYIKENFGELKEGKYKMVSLYQKYGDRGYQWR
jgi:hypothetical protein